MSENFNPILILDKKSPLSMIGYHAQENKVFFEIKTKYVSQKIVLQDDFAKIREMKEQGNLTAINFLKKLDSELMILEEYEN